MPSDRIVGVIEMTEQQIAVFDDIDVRTPIFEVVETIVVTAGSEQGPAGPTVSFTSETPTGSINGSNTVFTLSQTPGLLFLLTLNGLKQNEGLTNDFTRSGVMVTFTAAATPKTGDVINAIFSY